MSNTKNQDSKQPMQLELLLERETGSVGRHQIQVLIMCMLIAILSAFSTSEFVFTTGRIDTRCLIPECEGTSEEAEWLPSWLGVAIPSDGDGWDSCQRFANSSISSVINETCPAELFNQNNVISCDSYVYENTNTIVYDLELACDEWSRSFVGSARTIGAMLSLPLAGIVSDRFGRRTALAIASFNTAWMGVLRYFANTYIGFIVSVFIESAFGAGAILACGYVLLMEIVPAKYRVQGGAMSNSCFALGQVILGLIAWAVPYWRHFTLAIYTPQLLSILYFWLMPESIRWYLSKGRYDDAKAALKAIAVRNGREISEKTIIELKEAAEYEKLKAIERGNQKDPWLIVLVFRYKSILLRCLVLPICWITMTLVYYGLSINAVNIAGNPYLNYIAVSAIEIPGFWTAMLLLNRVGRKPILMVAYWVCALGQIAYIFIPLDIYGASLAVYLISKFSIAMVVTTLYLYTSEVFPTQYRHSLFAFSSMMGRLGSVVAPLTPALAAVVWDQLPFSLFAAFAFLSGSLALLMPETKGCRLPDTMEEAACLGNRKVNDTHQNNGKIVYTSRL